jgi:hypothetical protein
MCPASAVLAPLPDHQSEKIPMVAADGKHMYIFSKSVVIDLPSRALLETPTPL